MIYAFPESKPEKYSPGQLLLCAGYAEEAMTYLKAELAANRSPQTLTNMGVALRLLCQFDDANESYWQALEIDRKFSPAWLNAGILAEDEGEFTTCLECYKAAHLLTQNSQTAFRLATTLMRVGNFKEAMPLWESCRPGETYTEIPELPILTNLDQQRESWKVLAVREGGYGDVFMLARYLQELRRCGAKIVFSSWKCQREFLSYQGIGGVISPGQPVDPQLFDFHLPLMSAITAFCYAEGRLDYQAHDAYLTSEGAVMVFPSGKPLAGICWTAGCQGVKLDLRSLPVDALEPLRGKATYVALQPGPVPDWMVDCSIGTGWHETAAIISCCDLVISVDSAVAHLAAAMGKPTFTILPLGSDWKWGLDPEQTAWYPTMTLFRARKDPLSIADAVERVAERIP